MIQCMLLNESQHFTDLDKHWQKWVLMVVLEQSTIAFSAALWPVWKENETYPQGERRFLAESFSSGFITWLPLALALE